MARIIDRAAADPEGALDFSPGERAELETLFGDDETLLLALRLRARQQVLGEASAADLARARADLADDRLPALERWRLRGALVEALHAAGQAGEAAAQAVLADAEQARLAASLQAWPERRAAFLRSAAPG